MRSWEARCNDDGANLSCESVICNEAPDDDALVACCPHTRFAGQKNNLYNGKG